MSCLWCDYKCRSCRQYWWKKWYEFPIIYMGTWQLKSRCPSCKQYKTPYQSEELED